MARVLKAALVQQIHELSVGDNMPINEIARTLGISKTTVARYRASLGLAGVMCDCGELLNHRGWCPVRYRKSEATQKWVAFWHNREQETLIKSKELDDTFLGALDG